MSGALDWSGLLKWSLKYTDGTTATQRAPRSQEDLEFLENAFREFFGEQTDVNELVKEAVAKLEGAINNPSTDVQEELDAQILSALGVIQEGLDIHPEVSRNLGKFKALKLLSQALSHNNATILETVLSIICFASANNPPIQKELAEYGVVQTIFDIITSHREPIDQQQQEQGQQRLLVKALNALSALVKAESSLEDDFVNRNGLELICELMSETNDQRLLTKCCVFLDYFSRAEKLKVEKNKVALACAHAMEAIQDCTDAWGCTHHVLQTTLLLTDRYLTIYKRSKDKWNPRDAAGARIKSAALHRRDVLKEVDDPDCVPDELAAIEKLVKQL